MVKYLLYQMLIYRLIYFEIETDESLFFKSVIPSESLL